MTTHAIFSLGGKDSRADSRRVGGGRVTKVLSFTVVVVLLFSFFVYASSIFVM